MRKISKKIIVSIIILIIAIFLNNICYATAPKEASLNSIINPDDYKPTDTTGNNTQFIGLANVIVGTMRAVGTVIAVVALMVIGLRYMFGSLEERANYKETMVPYLIGAVMLFTIPNVLGIIYDLVKGINF